MICQDCKQRDAQVHLTQIVNNEKMSLSLCKECAAARGFHSPLDNIPFPLAEILSGIGTQMPSTIAKAQTENIVCSSCGLSFVDFTQQGRFGCGDCYSAFRQTLQQIMRKIHGASIHRGHSPLFTSDSSEPNKQPLPIKEEERLEEQLTKAIASEDFELAAEIRDKLKSVRQSMSAEM